MKLRILNLVSFVVVLVFISCEEKFPESEQFSEPDNTIGSAKLKSASLYNGSYQLLEVVDFDPLWKFHISGNNITLETDPTVTSWGNDYWGYWDEPFPLEGNTLTYIAGGLTKTTYTFDVLDNGNIDVRKLVIVTQYLSGDTTMNFSHPGIYQPTGDSGDPDDEPNTAPMAIFNVSANEGIAPSAISFDAGASSDAEGDDLSFAWDFGDGSTGSGVNVVHTYTQAGTFTANLTVSDGVLSNTAQEVITITEPDPAPEFCDNPQSSGVPLIINGRGQYCYEVSGTISYVNSWALKELTINGVDYTNRWSNSLPDPVNGKYYIQYRASRRWSHFEAK